MRTLTIATSLLFVGLSLAALAPAATAFDWCVEGTHKDCTSHVACIGRSYDSRGERCNVGVERPCFECYYLP